MIKSEVSLELSSDNSHSIAYILNQQETTSHPEDVELCINDLDKCL